MIVKLTPFPPLLSKADLFFSILIASIIYVYFLEFNSFEFAAALTTFVLSALWTAIYGILERYAAAVEKLEDDLPVRSLVTSVKISTFRAVAPVFAGISIYLFSLIQNRSYDQITNIGPMALYLLCGLIVLDRFLLSPYRKASQFK